MRTSDLIPPGIAEVRSQAYAALVDRFNYLDPTVVLTGLVDRVSASALPVLLAQWHVDFVKAGGDEGYLRDKIKGSVDWHRRKGTPDAVAGLVSEITGITPTIKERRYFLMGQSALGMDEISKPPNPGFRVGLAQLGIHGLGMPDKWFLTDVILDSRQAGQSQVKAADVDPLVAAVKPTRTWHTTRFAPTLLGHPDYGRLGIDTF
jgi:hypothetical protein